MAVHLKAWVIEDRDAFESDRTSPDTLCEIRFGSGAEIQGTICLETRRTPFQVVRAFAPMAATRYRARCKLLLYLHSDGVDDWAEAFDIGRD
jgi:hypothetical protein